MPLHDGFCRLCLTQAGISSQRLDHQLALAANRYGQQLWFADLAGFAKKPGRQEIPQTRADPPVQQRDRRNIQLVLFSVTHQLDAAGRAGLHTRADRLRTRPVELMAEEMAAANGWDSGLLSDTRIGLRIVIGLLDDEATQVNASQVEELKKIDLPVWTVRHVLARAGQLHDDRTPALDRYFTEHTQALPDPMRGELAIWFDVMKNGAPTPPRRRRRSDATISLQLRWALPTLKAWAADGHTTLREITREHVLDALPAAGNARSTTGQGLKSIFRVLKQRRVLFTDPTARVKTGEHQAQQPVPVNLDLLRAALNSPQPAQAFVVSLIAFHGLRMGHLQRLHLTDHRDGRLHVDGRVIPLAQPVQDRLRDYLNYRGRTWPHSSNPHLLINRRSSGRLGPVGRRWIRLTVGPGLSPTAIREDRILSEAHATGGDVRRLVDLFGLSVQASIRYTATIDDDDFRTSSSATHHPT